MSAGSVDGVESASCGHRGCHALKPLTQAVHIKAPCQRADASFFFSTSKCGSGELPHSHLFCCTFLNRFVKRFVRRMGPKHGFKHCQKCNRFLSSTDPHKLCLWCLGHRHDTASYKDCQSLTPKARRERSQKLLVQRYLKAP